MTDYVCEFGTGVVCFEGVCLNPRVESLDEGPAQTVPPVFWQDGEAGELVIASIGWLPEASDRSDGRQRWSESQEDMGCGILVSRDTRNINRDSFSRGR